MPEVSTRLERLVEATSKTLNAFKAGTPDSVLCLGLSCDRGAAHYLPGPWNEATRESKKAREEAYRLAQFFSEPVATTKPDDGRATSKPDAEPATAAVKPNWKSVKEGLLQKRARGETYTSGRKLACEFGCLDSMIGKAINDSVTLKNWKARGGGDKKAPPAAELNEIVVETDKRLSKGIKDAAILPDDDVDALISLATDKATPEDRAKLNALSPEQRREFAALMQESNADAEISPVNDGTPDRWRGAKHHKTA